MKRRDYAVGDDIVDEVNPQSPRIAEVANLNGRRTLRQDPDPRVESVAHQVNDNMDLETSYELRHLLVGLAGHVNEPIERPSKTAAHRAVVVRRERDADDFEALPVMDLEKLRGQIGDGMGVEVSRKVSQ